MPATKKATKKTTAKKVVGKKSAASAPVVKTRIIKSAESGEIVSKKFAKSHPKTTMAISIERPLAGAAKAASLKSHAPAKTSAPVKKAASKSAPAKKTAAKKAAAPAAKKAPAGTVRAAQSALSKVSTAAKNVSKAITKSDGSNQSIEREASKLSTATGKAIVQAVHVADAKHAKQTTTHRANAASVVTPRQQIRETGFVTVANPPLSSNSKAKSPFHPEAVPAAIESTRVADIQRPLLKSVSGMFS